MDNMKMALTIIE